MSIDATAEQLPQDAAARGNGAALHALAWQREKAGDHAAAEKLLRFGLTDDGKPADSLG
ncbi:hypothetical protein [Kribbella steppae]|uniref:hypothetical protein n=1 Tax=Kribbella steppae TaxID=2512223 RepID=UPI00130E3C6C|nr:hypothetical protein [Kribbella steppae]